MGKDSSGREYSQRSLLEQITGLTRLRGFQPSQVDVVSALKKWLNCQERKLVDGKFTWRQVYCNSKGCGSL
ncbi:hypothetical protein RRG08_020554 [Elysia crispata]|uniref:Uncharacterized protein n=1 Tax=Elysia crispata TaxID=231223 RepID=A0AAE1DT91_9GAST|nr:hypothetical protein RRG08_020554 [Elysia crispata]